MSGLNFSKVEAVKDLVMTAPGTIDVFKMKEVTFETSKNKGTYYMKVLFARKQDEFSNSFFLTEKALGRVKALVKHATGTELTGENVQEEDLISLLLNKEIALKVTGKVDETNGRGYPDLSFGGFCKPAAEVNLLAFTDKEKDLNAKANAARMSGSTSKPDAEDDMKSAPAPLASTGTAAAPGKIEEDEIF